MGTKRFKDQILYKILTTCKGKGASKTKVVYASNLNFGTVRPYLEILSADGLLEVTDGPIPLYKVTQKGRVVLEHLKALEDLMPSLRWQD